VPSKWFLISVFLFAATLILPLKAQVTLDVSKINCDQYVHSKIATPNYIAAWISGYYNAKQNNSVIDPQELHDRVGKLENFCYEEKNFKVPVMKAVEELFGKGKNKGSKR
jgi:acid stress chaperone HdeB